MTLLERLDALKAKTGDTNASLSRGTGIPYTTIDSFYKIGYKNIRLPNLQAIAKYFGVTLDYLVYGDEEEDCSELCNIYNGLNEEGKQALMKQARYIALDEDYKKKKADVV